jgi:glycosyltransferase involved in cell wall biosynthesis
MVQKSAKVSLKTPHLVFLITSDLDSPAGVGRYFPLSKNLVRQGYSVSIAALHPNFKALDKHAFEKEGVKVVYISQMHVKKQESKTEYFNFIELLWVSIKATWKFLVFLLSKKADVVVIGKPHPMNSLAGLIGGYLSGSKVILDCDDYEAASNFFSSSLQQKIVAFFEDTVPSLVHHITTNTQFNQQRMVDLGVPIDKIDYLPNGIDFERFSNIDLSKIKTLNSRLNLDGKIVVSYIGSLNLANHPVDLLIKAFKIVLDQKQNAILLIIGGGKDLEKLQDLAEKLGLKKHTIFEGRVPPEVVPSYYLITDVSVDPVEDTLAAKGRCPLKLFESWAMRTPFVTADIGDRRALAGEPAAFLLSSPGDYHDLAEKILKILHEPTLENSLVTQGLARVNQFSWQNLAEEFSKILEKIIIKP